MTTTIAANPVSSPIAVGSATFLIAHPAPTDLLVVDLR
jgi:hypothetical protein